MTDLINLLKLVKKHGSLAAVKSIDIEDIDDITIKIICRTLVNSDEQLIELLKENSLQEKKSA